CLACTSTHRGIPFYPTRRSSDLKTRVLIDQLTRLGGLDPARLEGLAVEPLPWEEGPLSWRTRMQYAVDAEGKAGLRRHKSREVVHIDWCRIASEPVRSAGVLSRNWKGGGKSIGAVGVVDSDDDELPVYTPL